MTSIADLASVRTFLRRWCDTEVALDRLEVSHLTVGPDGPRTALYEGPGPGGQVLRLVAQRVESTEGRRLEAELNRDCRRSGAPAAAGFLQPAIYAPELHLLFQVFPADGRLGALAQAADGSAMAAVLEAALAARTGGARLAGVAVHVVRYKPARKCLFRYELTWAGGAAPSRPAVVYAKVARRSKFERTRHILGRICAAADGLVFELPEPLGFVPELCMELFSPVAGVPFSTLAAADHFPALCRRVAAALHQLHALPIDIGREHGAAANAARVAAGAAEFAALLPAERPRIAALGRALRARLGALPASRPGLIHGDFHGDNVVVDGTRLGLLDLEGCATGDPADDVGSMWAQLTWLGCKAGASASTAGRDAFLAAYLARADGEAAVRVPVHAAMHCFLYAYQCLRHPRRRGRHEHARALLAACEATLADGRG